MNSFYENSTVSVIIPSFNNSKTIGRAIQSVITQDYKDVEIIVVDGESTDETANILCQFSKFIRIIRRKNEGPGAARNTGILAARGGYIAFLDSDDEWIEGKLSKQLKLLRTNPNIGFVSCAAQYVNQAGLSLFHGSTEFQGRLYKILLLKGNVVVTSSVVARKSCLLNAGGFFREDVRLGEDWEFWVRLSARYDGVVSRDVLVKYTLSPPGKYSIDYLNECYQKILIGLGQDQILGEEVRQNWKRLQMSLRLMSVSWLILNRQPWRARKELLNLFVKSPSTVPWLKALVIFFLPHSVIQYAKQMRALNRRL